MPAPRVLEPDDDLGYGNTSAGRVIEGDNLQVMVSLRSQYLGAVDVAYLDPPYNTGKSDFAYSDRRFHDPNADADDLVYVNNEDGGRHTKWLNYMGPRLWLVWQLLAEHGVCFVSIDDSELFRLGLLMDEIFGEANRIGVLVWKQATENNPTRIAIGHEYILCYAKRLDSVPRVWAGSSPAKDLMLDVFAAQKKQHRDLEALGDAYAASIKDHVAAYQAAVKAGDAGDLVDLGELARYNRVDARGPYAAIRNTDNPRAGGYMYDVCKPGSSKPYRKPTNGYRFPEETMRRLQAEDRVVYPSDHSKLVQLKKYLKDVRTPLRGIIELDSRAGANDLKKLIPGGTKQFPNPKPVRLIEQLLEFAADEDAVVLDPFAGSGTTAQAVMRLNARDGGARRFILIEEGTREDRYARTLIVPRLKEAIEQEELPGGFTFERKGRKLNRQAIVDLEREAITNLIIQTDTTGRANGIRRIEGRYVIGSNPRQEALCLCWGGRATSSVTSEVLVQMFEEASALGLRRPLRVYGSTCDVGETESFRFCQIPDEILAALQLDEESEFGESSTDTIETLESATLEPGQFSG